MGNGLSRAAMERVAAWAGRLSLAAFLAGLAAFAYAGTFARYWADDYCYAAVVDRLGVLRGAAEWYVTSGNRVTTLFAVGLGEAFGPGAIRFTALAVLVLWVLAGATFLRQLAPRAAGRTWAWLLAAASVYFAALLAPDRLQTIYWRMGTLHYTLPLPLLLFNLGLLIAQARRPRANAWALLASALLAAFAAGLSETAAALQAGLLAGLILAGLTFRRRLTGLAAPALVGTLAMMALMALSPSNAFRQAALPPPEHLWQIVPVTLRYADEFVFFTIRGAFVPILVYLLLVAATAWLAFGSAAQGISLRAALAGAAVSLLAAYALVACSFAPSAYAGLQYPAGRAQMPGFFALLAGLGAAAFFAALALRWLIPPRAGWVVLAAAALTLAAGLYPLRALPILRADVARLAVRAERWDARDAQIRAGQVQVRQTDVVQGLEDLGPQADFWVNRCAALYYRVPEIIAAP